MAWQWGFPWAVSYMHGSQQSGSIYNLKIYVWGYDLWNIFKLFFTVAEDGQNPDPGNDSHYILNPYQNNLNPQSGPLYATKDIWDEFANFYAAIWFSVQPEPINVQWWKLREKLCAWTATGPTCAGKWQLCSWSSKECPCVNLNEYRIVLAWSQAKI